MGRMAAAFVVAVAVRALMRMLQPLATMHEVPALAGAVVMDDPAGVAVMRPRVMVDETPGVAHQG